MGAAALLAAVTRERVGWPFAVTFLATSAVGLWYLVAPMYHYSTGYVGTVYYSGGYWIAAALAVVAAGFVWLMRIEHLRALTERWLPRAIAAVVAGLAIYAYFFREPGGRLAPQDAYALRRFAWYVTTVGLWIAIAGFIVLVLRALLADPAFFVTAAAYSALIFYKPRIVPEHFWTGRRFLTMILPAVMLSIAALATGAALDAELERPVSDRPAAIALDRWSDRRRAAPAARHRVLAAGGAGTAAHRIRRTAA